MFKAECINEPRGRSGLEGYQRGDTYQAERKEKDVNGKPYIKVWPSFEDWPGYYETCSIPTFNRYFKKVKATPAT